MANRFAGHYDAGWEVIRDTRIEAAKAKGLIPSNAIYRPFLRLWGMVRSESRAAEREARRMELYAAMIAYMDEQVGGWSSI